MSILLYVMVLVYLYGIQATNMGSSQQQQHEQGKSRDTEPRDTLPPVKIENFPLEDKGDRYNSPRVLLSDRPPLQPPPLYLSDNFVSSVPVLGAAGNKTRKKRHTEHKSYRGEYSVCDSVSDWVMNKTLAYDIKGQRVTVLAKFKTSATKDIRQFFYETHCRTSKPVKDGCRGIDDKNWNSQCKTAQSYVRALTQFQDQVSWRWIRINTSCVCALSKKRHNYSAFL
uniref:Neurotrophin-3 n=1 Tax=Pundamilia nyererei TaxID=303518 RepID=A0A3B4GF49_9CICH